MRLPRLVTVATAGAVGLAGLVVFLPGPPPPARLDGLAAAGGRHDVRILRDTFGVPHVFGRTDADTAYGLAWAHAEDDFATIQARLLAAKGRLASVVGREAAAGDYLLAVFGVRELVDERYEDDLSAETRALCEGYADGINHYAALHPGAALPGLYPVTGKDVVAGFVQGVPFFYGLDKSLQELFAPTRRRPTSRKGETRAATDQIHDEVLTGSNAIAVGPGRSADGFTRLAINSHQPWEGPVSWYEVHLHSEQGWDMVGGVFPGSPVVLHGHNRDLGWAHVVNRPDLVDVYVLEVNPENPSQYRFDGAWRDLAARSVAIDVRLWGPLHWRFEREVLSSVQGPVIRRPHGTYAIRYAGMGDIRQVEQWYRMSKARTLDEWEQAVRMGALPSFNIGYADREGNIEFLHNARLPLRAEGYDWSQYLPGDTSETLWTEYLPFERLPRVRNPPSGFIANCNSTPFQVTTGPGNPDPAVYSPTLGLETHLTNRELRALELFGGDDSITAEEFERYKFDTAYSARSTVIQRLLALLDGPPSPSPLVREAVEVLRRWDGRADAANPAAALALLTLRPGHDNRPPPVAPDELRLRLENAARDLKETFAWLDIPWGDVLRLRRGDVDLPLGGGPDTLHAVYARPGADGRLVGVAGDSYVLLVEWDREGRVHSRSIHPYGSATQDPRSPHYADQAPLFARRELKPVWMDEGEIRAHLEREYRPGAAGRAVTTSHRRR